jgi:hypothetical protein
VRLWLDRGRTLWCAVQGHKKSSALQALVNNLTNLRDSERDFIHRLLEENQEQRLVDAEEIEQLLRYIVRDLSTITTASWRDLVVAVRLGSDLDIARTIETVSEGKAGAHDPIAQRDWIREDLQGDIRVVARQRRIMFSRDRSSNIGFAVGLLAA